MDYLEDLDADMAKGILLDHGISAEEKVKKFGASIDFFSDAMIDYFDQDGVEEEYDQIHNKLLNYRFVIECALKSFELDILATIDLCFMKKDFNANPEP